MRDSGSSEHEQISTLIRAKPLWLALLLVLSGGLRLGTVMSRPAPLEGDSILYDGLAKSLLDGHGLAWASGASTAVVPPGYPAFLAGVYSVTSRDPFPAYLAQVLLGVVTVVLVGILAGLCLGRTQALFSGLMMAVYPVFCWLPRRLLSENLAVPLALGALCCAGMAQRKQSPRWAAVTGVLLGAGILVRGAGLLIAAVLLLGLLRIGLRNDRRYRAIGLAGLAGIACLLTLSPWLMRNLTKLGAPVLSTQSGLTLYSSYWPPRNGAKRIWGNAATEDDPEVRRAFGMRNEVETSKYLDALTRRRLLESPGYAISLLPEKLLNLLVPFDWEVLPPPPGRSRSLNVGYALLLLPAAYGAWTLFLSPTRTSWLVWVLPLAVLSQTAFFYGSPRFRLAAEPSLVILAALGLSSAFGRIRQLPEGLRQQD